MSDELLRHLASSSGRLSEMRVFNDKTGKEENVLTGQGSRLLMALCHHANKERICFVGRSTLMDETGLYGMSIDTAIRRFIASGILTHLGKKSYRGSIPVNVYLIDFPDLQPLDEALNDSEIRKRARSVSASRSVLNVDSTEVLNVHSILSLKSASPIRHKQKQITEHVHEYEQEGRWSEEEEPSEEEIQEMLDREYGETPEDPF